LFRFAGTTQPAAIAVILVLLVSVNVHASLSDERALSFRHNHTDETLDIVYWRDGDYLPDALEAINLFLRDFRSGDQTTIDPALLDLLHEVYTGTGSRGHFEVISAYRSPRTNAMLRAESKGVAKCSQHLLGKAIDVRLTDVPIETIRKIARELGGWRRLLTQVGLRAPGHRARSDLVNRRRNHLRPIHACGCKPMAM
jgi:uncharacterized protein YcbK (DUF882 family)